MRMPWTRPSGAQGEEDLNHRRLLISAHDVLVTVVALFVSFLLRWGSAEFWLRVGPDRARLRGHAAAGACLLLVLPPAAIALAVRVDPLISAASLWP